MPKDGAVHRLLTHSPSVSLCLHSVVVPVVFNCSCLTTCSVDYQCTMSSPCGKNVLVKKQVILLRKKQILLHNTLGNKMVTFDNIVQVLKKLTCNLHPTGQRVAHNTDLNPERSIRYSLHLNWVMQGYTDLQMKHRAELLPRSPSSFDQPQSPSKQVNDETQLSNSYAHVQIELDSLANVEAKTYLS